MSSLSKYCAYCGSTDKLTKEHVFPDLTNRLFPDLKLTGMNGVDNIFIADLTISDVCRKCNNGVLSFLDSYGKSLSENYFINHVVDKITFDYNFNLLLRWLLKITYNGSRAFKTSYSEFKPYINYILGDSSVYPKTLLFGGLIKPSFYNGKIIFPNRIAVSEVMIKDREFANIVISKMFYVQSFSFIIIGWDIDPSEEVNRVVDSIYNEFGFIPLYENNNKVIFEINKSKFDYLEHIKVQQLISPKTIDSVEELKKKVPKMRLFNFQQNYLLNENISQTLLIFLEHNKHLISLLGIRKDRVHKDLIVDNKPISAYSLVNLYKYAGVKIERKGSKTYVDIIDYYDLINPYVKGNIGINQSYENWEKWKNGIINNNNILFLTDSTDLKDIKANKINLLSKIKVIEIIENN